MPAEEQEGGRAGRGRADERADRRMMRIRFCVGTTQTVYSDPTMGMRIALYAHCACPCSYKHGECRLTCREVRRALDVLYKLHEDGTQRRTVEGPVGGRAARVGVRCDMHCRLEPRYAAMHAARAWWVEAQPRVHLRTRMGGGAVVLSVQWSSVANSKEELGARRTVTRRSTLTS
jgi:hypothetical protein